MVFINVSVRRGSRELFPYRLLDFSPALTLRDVTEHTLREDASLMVAVEARERIESGTSTTLTGDSLAATVADIKAMGLNCVSLVLAAPSSSLEPTKTQKPSAFQQMMVSAQNRAQSVSWPADYPSGANQSTRDILNKLLGILRSDAKEYGGFGSDGDAAHTDNHFFWRLAVIVENVVPHAKTLSDRSCSIPKVFLQAADRSCSRPHSGHLKGCAKHQSDKQLSQEQCGKYVEQLNSILDKPDVRLKRFRFQFHITQLKDALAKYRHYLQRRAEETLKAQHSTDNPQRIRGAYVVPAAARAFSELPVGAQLAVTRIADKLRHVEPLVPIRVDHLLFSDDENRHHETLADPATATRRRLHQLFDEVISQTA